MYHVGVIDGLNRRRVGCEKGNEWNTWKISVGGKDDETLSLIYC